MTPNLKINSREKLITDVQTAVSNGFNEPLTIPGREKDALQTARNILTLMGEVVSADLEMQTSTRLAARNLKDLFSIMRNGDRETSIEAMRAAASLASSIRDEFKTIGTRQCRDPSQILVNLKSGDATTIRGFIQANKSLLFGSRDSAFELPVPAGSTAGLTDIARIRDEMFRSSDRKKQGG